jgi:hypothetical protein
MKFTHENPTTNHRRLNIRDLGSRNEHSQKISIESTEFNPIQPHARKDDAVVVANINNSVHGMKNSLKKVYEVVRGLFGLDRMPIARAEEIVRGENFRKDETPEQLLMTIAGAKKVLAKRDAQINKEKPRSRHRHDYILPQSAQKSCNTNNLRALLAKRAKEEKGKN